MTTCATCNHWTEEANTPAWGSCALIVVQKGRPYAENALAVPRAKNNGDAQLETAANFGCNQWDDKVREYPEE